MIEEKNIDHSKKDNKIIQSMGNETTQRNSPSKLNTNTKPQNETSDSLNYKPSNSLEMCYNSPNKYNNNERRLEKIIPASNNQSRKPQIRSEPYYYHRPGVNMFPNDYIGFGVGEKRRYDEHSIHESLASSPLRYSNHKSYYFSPTHNRTHSYNYINWKYIPKNRKECNQKYLPHGYRSSFVNSKFSYSRATHVGDYTHRHYEKSDKTNTIGSNEIISGERLNSFSHDLDSEIKPSKSQKIGKKNHENQVNDECDSFSSQFFDKTSKVTNAKLTSTTNADNNKNISPELTNINTSTNNEKQLAYTTQQSSDEYWDNDLQVMYPFAQAQVNNDASHENVSCSVEKISPRKSKKYGKNAHVENLPKTFSKPYIWQNKYPIGNKNHFAIKSQQKNLDYNAKNINFKINENREKTQSEIINLTSPPRNFDTCKWHPLNKMGTKYQNHDKQHSIEQKSFFNTGTPNLNKSKLKFTSEGITYDPSTSPEGHDCTNNPEPLDTPQTSSTKSMTSSNKDSIIESSVADISSKPDEFNPIINLLATNNTGDSSKLISKTITHVRMKKTAKITHNNNNNNNNNNLSELFATDEVKHSNNIFSQKYSNSNETPIEINQLIDEKFDNIMEAKNKGIVSSESNCQTIDFTENSNTKSINAKNNNCKKLHNKLGIANNKNNIGKNLNKSNNNNNNNNNKRYSQNDALLADSQAREPQNDGFLDSAISSTPGLISQTSLGSTPTQLQDNKISTSYNPLYIDTDSIALYNDTEDTPDSVFTPGPQYNLFMQTNTPHSSNNISLVPKHSKISSNSITEFLNTPLEDSNNTKAINTSYKTSNANNIKFTRKVSANDTITSNITTNIPNSTTGDIPNITAISPIGSSNTKLNIINSTKLSNVKKTKSKHKCGKSKSSKEKKNYFRISIPTSALNIKTESQNVKLASISIPKLNINELVFSGVKVQDEIQKANQNSKINDKIIKAFSEWRCAFCHLKSNEYNLGYLTGPYFQTGENLTIKPGNFNAIRKTCLAVDNNEIWVHSFCALWTPGIYLTAFHIHGLLNAYNTSRSIYCSKCQENGATLFCQGKLCTNTYHYVCAVNSSCYLDIERFQIYCCNHIQLII